MAKCTKEVLSLLYKMITKTFWLTLVWVLMYSSWLKVKYYRNSSPIESINQSINWWILALSQYNLNPDNIDMVVITHGHLDHTGNQNFFAHKIVLFDHLEFLENRFYETTLKKVIVKPL